MRYLNYHRLMLILAAHLLASAIFAADSSADRRNDSLQDKELSSECLAELEEVTIKGPTSISARCLPYLVKACHMATELAPLGFMLLPVTASSETLLNTTCAAILPANSAPVEKNNIYGAGPGDFYGRGSFPGLGYPPPGL